MAELEFLDGVAVRRWCALATEALGAAKEQIDALNVFPVADSDTGTNLHMTMLAAAKALDGLPESAGQEQVWQALARGALLGAQGNSGVIVSQYLRGFAEVCGPAFPCDGAVARRALAHAARLSHAAVGEPVEGTVLTVASAAAQAAARAATGPGDGLAGVTTAAANGAREALARTTAQLDVLARAGVVDAGAVGLCIIFDALAAVVTGRPAEWAEVPSPAIGPVPESGRPHMPDGQVPAGHSLDGHGGEPGADPPGYEVMYLLEAADDTIPQLRGRLGELGDSLVVVGGEGLWNVHVHAADPGAAIEAGIATGRPYRIRVTYLGIPGSGAPAGEPAAVPACEATIEPVSVAADGEGEERSGHAVVAVAAADRLARLYEEAGAVVVRRQGGRMPDHAGLLAALRRESTTAAAEADGGRAVALLPGDPEVAALAETVAAQARDAGIQVTVLPSHVAVQSLSALAVHDPSGGFEDDVAAMAECARATRHGRVTWAAGRAVGFVGDEAVTSGSDAGAVAAGLADALLSTGGDLVTLLAGAPQSGDAPAGREVAARVAAHLYATRPDVEILSHEGGETGYLLMIGVE